MPHHNHDIDNSDRPYEEINQWELACFQCHRPVSADRPPNYNCENCSSVEVGTHANGLNGYTSHPMEREQPIYNYDTTTQTHYHNQSPQSCVSSNLSGQWPEGPEREDPSLHFTPSFLPLGPPVGLNEVQHQRTASLHSDMSLPMLRFLGENDFYGTTEHVPPMENRFLSQDLHIQSQISKKVQKSTKRSKQSYMSMQSSGSHETGFSWGLLDPVTETGAWDRERWDHEGGNLLPEDYPLTLSGLTINDNTN